MHLELTADQVLTTTRSVRKRFDLSRPVEMDVLRECVKIATQAPSGSNIQPWRFLFVIDPEKRRAIASLYQLAFEQYYLPIAKQLDGAQSPELQRVHESAVYLTEHLQEIPVLLIPCIEGGSNPLSPPRLDQMPNPVQAANWGSILPAVWSFMLAARERGLGTSWTTLHLFYEEQAAEILGIPYDHVTQTALIPIAYTKGTEFRPAPRKPFDNVVGVDGW